MKRGLTVYMALVLLVLLAGITATAKKKPTPEPDFLTCTGIQSTVSAIGSTPFDMKGTYEDGSWTDERVCRIWPEEGDAEAEFTFPDGVEGTGQIWQLDRSQLRIKKERIDRCYLHILMDSGQHYRVRQLVTDGLVMEYDEVEDSWFFQFNDAELWNNDGYVANVWFELTVVRE